MSAIAQTVAPPQPNCPPPDPDPKRPDLALPPLACDSHFHIFGPGHVFPYAPQRTFTPHDAPLERLLALHRFLGFERGVFVQSACHGSDHAAVLAALAVVKDRYRAVALLEATTTPDEIARLDRAGFCGVRFHFAAHLAGQSRHDMEQVMRLVAPHGWHIAFHTMHDGVAEHFDFIRSIAAPVVIDHVGRFDIAEGEAGAGFAALRRLVDTGKVWVKLSGIDRLSGQPPPYADAIGYARILADQAPERMLWGSDWPHPNHRQVPNDGVLVDLIGDVVPDEKRRQLMLVDNPAEFFRFA